MEGIGLKNARATEFRDYIQRIVRLEEERSGLAADISDIKAEMKAKGYNPKAVAQALKELRMKSGEREQFQSDLEVYRENLGLLGPLGQAALERLSREDTAELTH